MARPVGQAVTLVSADEIDIRAATSWPTPGARPEVADSLQPTSSDGRRGDAARTANIMIKAGTRLLPGQVTSLRHKGRCQQLDHLACGPLKLNESGYCNLSTPSRSRSMPMPKTATQAVSS